MGSQFFISFNNYATSAGPLTTAKLFGVAGKQYEITEVIGNGAGQANPADIQHEIWASFCNTAGAGTSTIYVPKKKDSASGVSVHSASVEFTAEPTTYATSNDTLFSFNQRGGMRYAVPEGYGFKNQGGAANFCFGMRVLSSSAGFIDGSIHWIENG